MLPKREGATLKWQTLLVARIEINQHVTAPAKALWSVLADLESHPTWMKDAEALEFLTTQTSGKGTVMRVPTRVGPLRTTDILEIVEWDEGRSMKVDHRGIVTGSGQFTVSDDPPGSRITWQEDLRFPIWWGGSVTAWFAKPILRWIWRGNLKRLATHVEAFTDIR